MTTKKAMAATGKRRKRNMEVGLAERGYVPRVVAARQLRAMADEVERGGVALFIRSPELDPRLWVKFNINFYYETAEDDVSEVR